MKKTIFFLKLALCVGLITACKRYSGGGFSNRAENNLRNGIDESYQKAWQVSSYIVDGIDSTEFFKTESGTSNNSFRKDFVNIDVTVEGSALDDENFVFRTEIGNSYYATLGGKRKSTLVFRPKFVEDSAAYRCEVDGFNQICEKSIFWPEPKVFPKLVWTIRKLTKDELIITALGSFSYRITLHRVETFA